MTKLSPAAQAVLSAVCDNTEPDCDTQHLIAAALRAVADYDPPDNPHAVYDMGWYIGMGFIQSIADELEAQ